jgi:hypothetical protein
MALREKAIGSGDPEAGARFRFTENHWGFVERRSGERNAFCDL